MRRIVERVALVLLLVAMASRDWGEVLARDCLQACGDFQLTRAAQQCRGERMFAMRQWANATKELDCESLFSKLRLELLLTTPAAPYAAYTLAYHCEGAVRDAYMLRAIAAFQNRANHSQAAKLAASAGNMVLEGGKFAAALDLAALAAREEEQGPNRIIRGRIRAVFAETYDAIGMERAAQRFFEQAEALLASSPDEVANTYLKHGNYLLDLRDPENVERALRYYDAAEEAVEQARAQGKATRVAKLPFALALNRADALSQLRQLDEAAEQLALVQDEAVTQEQQDRALLVAGYIAARRGDVAAAERAFQAAGTSEEVGDYRWISELELARTYAAANDLESEERSLRSAIAIVTELRAGAEQELRPWILARRNFAYQELFKMLVKQRRNREALAMAEALSAQTWLEATLSVRKADEPTQEEALLSGRLRAKMSSAAWLATNDSAPPGDREILLYLEVGDRIWRGHVRQGEVSFQELPPETADQAASFLKNPDDAIERHAASLALLPPDLAPRGGPLYVIAYGKLADVPFAALEQHGAFLGQARDVARIPSLAALRCRPRTWSAETVVLGDARNNLPAATREAQRLAGAMATVAYLNQDATREALFRAKDARLLHVATHGEQGQAGRALQLADGEVTAAEILDRAIAPEVAVLSGCATAASTAPEAWNGFPFAFLAAGSRYVIATLRSVEDAAAARVVSAYYAQPPGSPIARLAAAQRSLIGALAVKDWSAFAAWGADDCDSELALIDLQTSPP